MDGLECSEVLLSELENSLTLGAEYYSKNFINIVNKLKLMSHVTLAKTSEIITDGDHGSPDYQDEGVLYLISECIKMGYLDLAKAKYITKDKHEELKRSALHAGDVVVTKTGVYFGISAVIPDDFQECNTIAHVGKITLKKSYNPYVVSSFLNSKYGYYQMRRRGLKATRPEIKLIEMQDILIPLFKSERLGDKIKEIIKKGQGLIYASQNVFTKAERIIINNINGFALPSNNTSIKNFSEVSSSGRLDAEYYQEKYDKLFWTIENSKANPAMKKIVRLDDIVSISKSIEPGSDAYCDDGIPFVRVADISKYEIQNPSIYLSRKNYDISALKPKKDTILLSKDGSVGIAYKVNEDRDVITSGGLLHLTVTDSMINPDYLTLLLNSKIVAMQAERDSGGSIIKHWRVDEIKKVVLPILKEEYQEQIATKVQEAFLLREQSKTLLQAAIRAVEIAIEQDEPAAMAYLQEKLEQYRIA